MMEENGFDAAFTSLDHITELLNEMLWMSARAADPDCGDAERMLLQRDFRALKEKLDLVADRYEDAAVAGVLDRITRGGAIMETLPTSPETEKTGV